MTVAKAIARDARELVMRAELGIAALLARASKAIVAHVTWWRGK